MTRPVGLALTPPRAPLTAGGAPPPARDHIGGAPSLLTWSHITSGG